MQCKSKSAGLLNRMCNYLCSLYNTGLMHHCGVLSLNLTIICTHTPHAQAQSSSSSEVPRYAICWPNLCHFSKTKFPLLGMSSLHVSRMSNQACSKTQNKSPSVSKVSPDFFSPGKSDAPFLALIIIPCTDHDYDTYIIVFKPTAYLELL